MGTINNVWFVVLISTLFLIRVYSPLWAKEEKTLLLSDEELLLLFPDNTQLQLSEFIGILYEAHGISASASELAGRFKILVVEGYLEKSEVLEVGKNNFYLEEDDSARKIVRYSRVS